MYGREDDFAPEPRWRRRDAVDDGGRLGDTGLHVVVPTGQPDSVTGSRPAAHSTGGRLPRLDRYGWVLACSLLVILIGVVLVATRPHERSTVEPLANPSQVDVVGGAATPVLGFLPQTTGAPAAPPPAAPTAPAASAPASPVPARYAAVAGEGCSQTADRSFTRKGFSSDWHLRTHGGSTGAGCTGAALAVPMSGDAHKDDNSNVVVWSFATAPVTDGTCRIDVFVPDTGTDADSAGQPAHYLVYGTGNASGSVIGQFDVDQPHHRGRFVDAGTYRTGGQLSVRLATRGVDFGSGRDGAHLGAAAVRVSCAASA